MWSLFSIFTNNEAAGAPGTLYEIQTYIDQEEFVFGTICAREMNHDQSVLHWQICAYAALSEFECY